MVLRVDSGWRSLRVLVLVLLAACAPSVDAELLELTGASSGLLGPGAGLEIMGQALPVDRDGRCALRGLLHVPGRAPVSVDVDVPLRVTSTSLARTPPLGRVADVLAQRGSFVGSLRVSFSSATSGARVTGSLRHVRFDLGPGRAVSLASRLAAETQARRAASELGIEFEASDEQDAGLRVHAVAAGSAAARAELRPGDTLSDLGGLRLLALSDFQPVPDASYVRVGYERAGVPGRARLELDPSDRDPLRSVALALAGLVLAISLLLSPLTQTFDPARPRATPTPRLRLRHLLSLGLRFAGLLFSSSLLARTELDLLSGSALLAVLGAAAAFGDASARRSPALRVILRVLSVEAPTLMVLAAALLGFGASRLSELALMQTAAPAGWALTTSPLATLAAAALFLALRRDTRSGQTRVASALLAARRVAGAALFTALFCGGAALLLRPAMGALLFALEAGLVLLLLELSPRRSAASKGWLLPLLALSTLALTLAPEWLRVILPRGTELGVGLLLTLAVFSLVSASRLRRRPDPRWLVHPFL